MAHRTCVVCSLPGTPRGCCPEEPRLCEEHYKLHRSLTHGDEASRRSVDDALVTALTEEGFEE